MIKTNEEIEQFIYDTLAPLLAKDMREEEIINGDLYPEDCRPLDSMLEDAVIAVGSGIPGQIQTGHARINIYVPDIDNGSGRKVKDKDRCIALSQLDKEILHRLKSADTDYYWWLFMTTVTIADPAIEQHFVNINLSFNCNITG